MHAGAVGGAGAAGPAAPRLRRRHVEYRGLSGAPRRAGRLRDRARRRSLQRAHDRGLARRERRHRPGAADRGTLARPLHDRSGRARRAPFLLLAATGAGARDLRQRPHRRPQPGAAALRVALSQRHQPLALWRSRARAAVRPAAPVPRQRRQGRVRQQLPPARLAVGGSGAARDQDQLALTDLVLSSLEDEAGLHGVGTAEEACDLIHGFGPRTVVIKQGAQGCVVSINGGKTIVPAIKVDRIVDATAAGNSFNAGFLAATLRGEDPLQAARLGHRCAAIVIGHHGAIVPRAAFLAALRA